MPAVYSNFQSGTITNNPLTIGATSISSSQFANLPTIAAPDFMYITLDPDGVGGAPEIVLVTAHTAASTTVTATRGQQGTTARSHNVNTVWRHGLIAADVNGLPAKLLTSTGDLLYASAAYTPARLGVGATGTVLKGGSAPSWGTVDAAGLASNAVTTAKIADANVTLAKLAADSVDASKIVSGAVGTDELAAGAVTNAKMAANSVASSNIVDLTIVDGDISNSANIAVSKLAAGTGGQVLMAGPIGGQATYTDLSGDVTVSNIGVVTIGAGKVTNAMLSTGTGEPAGAWNTASISAFTNVTGGAGTIRWQLTGKTLTGSFLITAGTATAGGNIQIALPTGTVQATVPVQAHLTGGAMTSARAVGGATTITIFKTTGAGTWTASDSVANTYGQFVIELQ